MQDKKNDKPKRLRRQDILKGLRAGKRYMRSYDLDGGMYEGVESFIPIGPDFTKAKHICRVTGGAAGEQTNEGTEALDGEFVYVIESAKGWKEF